MLNWFSVAQLPREQRIFSALRVTCRSHCQRIRGVAPRIGWRRRGPAPLPNRDAARRGSRCHYAGSADRCGPFDRGDIKDLITAMDDAIDQMQKTAKAIVPFEMKSFEREMRVMADAIVDCAVGITGSTACYQHWPACRTAQRDLPTGELAKDASTAKCTNCKRLSSAG